MFTRSFYKLFLIFAIFLFVAIAVQAQVRPGSQKRDAIRNDQNIIQVALGNLEQCKNGTELVPLFCATADRWENGNANQNMAHWSESEFVSYRLTLTGLTTGSHTVVIGYDILKNAKHAVDYLGSFNATETTADPCAGMSCSGGPSTFAIPTDTVTVTNQTNPNTGLPVVQKPGAFSLWGGTVTDVQYVTYAGGEQRQISVTFTASSPNPVLAWGGHIAFIGDWGAGNSATSINGSPFHMSIVSIDGSGGGQELALDSSAVIPAGAVFVKEEVFTAPPDTSNGAFTTFNFTSSAAFGATAFGLIDDNGGPGIDVQQSLPITSFGTVNMITVNQSATAGWTLLNVKCTEDVTQDSTKNSALPTATIIVQPGETVTCTYSNSQLAPTAAPASISGQVTDGVSGIPNATVKATNPTTGFTSAVRTDQFGYFQISALPTGVVYIVQVKAKGYVFDESSRIVSLLDDVAKLNFTANPR